VQNNPQHQPQHEPRRTRTRQEPAGREAAGRGHDPDDWYDESDQWSDAVDDDGR
jgi:hypothetical protein